MTRKVVAKLIRYGECSRCGDCCRTEEFKIPALWENGKCKYLKGNKCIVDMRTIFPLACLLFPTGREDYILKKLAKGERLDFNAILPNCTFWFEMVYE